jgi:Carboxypeptidase regulatory-like domain
MKDKSSLFAELWRLMRPLVLRNTLFRFTQARAAHESVPFSRRTILAVSQMAGLLALFCVLTASSMWAQQNATLVGTITDPTGAVVPGATVTATNVNTGVKRVVITNSTGYYRVGNLIPGQYTLAAEAKGFQKAERTVFTLVVAQTATIDLTMRVGSVTQTVEVSGVTPMLQSQTAEIGQVIQRQEVEKLPLVDRNYLRLALLSPGTSSYYNRSFESGALTNGIGTINVGGEGEDRNAFILDGADVKAYLINFSMIPSVDAIQEFKIETTPYAADLGTSPGAQIIITTRTGTNRLHGTAWEYLRNDKMDAKNYFAATKPELRKNQFGAVLGGPIKKDRLFFFANFEAYRQRVGQTFFGSVPTPLMRNGNLSELNFQVYDPATTAPCSTCTSGYSRQPFPGNIITGNFNSATMALLNAYPAETGSGLNSAGQFIGSNYSSNGVDRVTRNDFMGRIDYSAPNGKDVVYGRFSMENATADYAKGVFGTGSLPGFGDHYTLPTRNIVLHEAHTFNSTTVMEGMASFFRAFPYIHPAQEVNPSTDILNSTLGIQGVRQSEPPDISVSGLSSLQSNPFAPEYDLTNQFQYIIQLTKVAGRHTLKFGGEYDRWQFYENHAPRYPMGLYGFGGSFTADPNNPGGSGSGIADFILGFPSSGQTIIGDDSGYYHRNNVRYWVNDQFRATRDLTLNFGLRWEYDGPPCEKGNHLDNFDVATNTVVIAGTPYAGQSGSSAFFGFPVRGSNCSTVNRYLNGYAPRFGFAYSLPGHSSTVVRGGYGIFDDVIQMNILNDTRANFPWAVFPNISYVNPYVVNPTISIQDAFAPGANLPAPSFKAMDPNLRLPYSQHASLSIEHQFRAPVMVSLGGTWLHNTGFFSQQNLNVPLQNGTFIRPIPQLVGLTFLTNDQYGHYYALMASLQSRQWHGATLITAFTWGKSLDNTSAGDASVGAPGDSGWQDPHNIAASFGRSSHDFERRFTQGWVYDVPTPFGSQNYRVLNGILGGWEWSGVLTLQSGFPITPHVGFDNSQSLQGADRPDVVPGVARFLPGNHDPYQWFNPYAFAIPARGTFGNAGRGIFDGPGIFTMDTGVMKNFKVKENVGLQFRIEGFNVLNHPNFADPSNSISNPLFTGKITSLTLNMRELQAAIRLSF